MSWVWVALSVLASDPATASPEDRARALYLDGQRQYDLGNFDAAIAAFKSAYELSDAPELLYNIAQAYRLKGVDGCESAQRFYRSFLRSDPKTPKRRAVEAAISDMSRCIAEHPQPVPVPGSPSPPVGATPSPSQPRWILPALLGGAASATLGGGLMIWSHQEYNRVRTLSCAPACPPQTLAFGQTTQTIGVALVAVGAAGLLSAGAGWFWSRPSGSIAVAASLSGAVLSLRF